nr:hypothetical protein Iba_chr11cCG2950 [Ipomoea batatas]
METLRGGGGEGGVTVKKSTQLRPLDMQLVDTLLGSFTVQVFQEGKAKSWTFLVCRSKAEFLSAYQVKKDVQFKVLVLRHLALGDLHQIQE